jgi:poly-gamma-glutamate synthesis protein (capsule biosynthesis protein)
LRRGRLIAYSLGNFVFWQPGDLYYRRTGFVLNLGVRRGGLAGFEIMPYRITELGLRRLRGREAQEFRRSLDRVSKPLASPKGVAEAWSAYLSYYGPAGFKKEVLSILERMETEPEKGAAMFRNRLTTLQHAELWRDALTEFMAGAPKPAPPRPTRTIAEWFTRPVDE